jgi:hypothetical protein
MAFRRSEVKAFALALPPLDDPNLLSICAAFCAGVIFFFIAVSF